MFLYRHLEARVFHPFEKARSTLQQDYFNTLMSDQWREEFTQRGGAQLTVRHIQAEDQSESILYTDTGFTESIRGFQRIGIDATFKVCPQKPEMRQFLTIMAHVNGVVSN